MLILEHTCMLPDLWCNVVLYINLIYSFIHAAFLKSYQSIIGKYQSIIVNQSHGLISFKYLYIMYIINVLCFINYIFCNFYIVIVDEVNSWIWLDDHWLPAISLPLTTHPMLYHLLPTIGLPLITYHWSTTDHLPLVYHSLPTIGLPFRHSPLVYHWSPTIGVPLTSYH